MQKYLDGVSCLIPQSQAGLVLLIKCHTGDRLQVHHPCVLLSGTACGKYVAVCSVQEFGKSGSPSRGVLGFFIIMELGGKEGNLHL